MKHGDEFLSKSPDVLDALEKSVANLLKVGAVFCRALETRLVCKRGHETTAFHAPPDGVCKCGEWLAWKNGPSPSDVPAPPEAGLTYEEMVEQERRRLEATFHGTRAALRRAAEQSVKSRQRGALDGQPFHERPMPAPRKKSPRIL